MHVNSNTPAVGVHHTGRGSDNSLNGDVHHTVVDQSGGEGGEACHDSMHSVLGKKHAVHGVAGIGGHRSNPHKSMK